VEGPLLADRKLVQAMDNSPAELKSRANNNRDAFHLRRFAPHAVRLSRSVPIRRSAVLLATGIFPTVALKAKNWIRATRRTLQEATGVFIHIVREPK